VIACLGQRVSLYRGLSLFLLGFFRWLMQLCTKKNENTSLALGIVVLRRKREREACQGGLFVDASGATEGATNFNDHRMPLKRIVFDVTKSLRKWR
jgi:hypothetical protein